MKVSLSLVLLCCLKITSAAESGNAVDGVVDFIVNGNNADINTYPFMAALLYNNVFTCGGSIINENWILTAAHCLYESSGSRRSESSFTVVTGSADVDKGTRIQAASSVVHPNFQYTLSYTDDIALLKLSSPLVFSSTTKATLLPVSGKDVPTSTSSTLLGWGFTSTSGNPTPSNSLQQATLQVYDQSSCSSFYSPIGKTVAASEFCAMTPGGGPGQCNGDSGGPLLTTTPKGLTQIGVVSFSQKPCGQHPGVFTKVSNYIDFIKSNTGT